MHLFTAPTYPAMFGAVTDDTTTERAERYTGATIDIRMKKVFARESGMAEVVLANSNVGFGMEFIRYAQKLHFHGFLPFSALIKSRAAIFKSPTTRRFEQLLSPTRFPRARIKGVWTCWNRRGKHSDRGGQIRRTTPNLASTS